MTQNKHKN